MGYNDLQKVIGPIAHGNWTILIYIFVENTKFEASHNRITDIHKVDYCSNSPKCRLRWRLTLRKLLKYLNEDDEYLKNFNGTTWWKSITDSNREQILNKIREM